MRDDDQDFEVTDGQLSQFANFAENEEQIASKMNLVDDDVLADPIPIIPQSMLSSFSQVKVSSQNFAQKGDEKEKTAAKKDTTTDAATPSVNPPDGSQAPDERDEDVAAADAAGMESKTEDDYDKHHAAFINRKYDIKKVIPGDSVYGHPEFVNRMKRFLPDLDEKQEKWSYGWYRADTDTDYSNKWDQNLHKGGETATEGMYPTNEETSEKSWAYDKGGRNYGAWNKKSDDENLIKKPTVLEPETPEDVSESSSGAPEAHQETIEPASLVQSTTKLDASKWEDAPEWEATPKPDTRNVFQTMADSSIDLAQSGAKADATNWNDNPFSEYIPKPDTRNVFQTMADQMIGEEGGGQDDAADVNAPWF